MRLIFTILFNILITVQCLASAPERQAFEFIFNGGQWPAHVQFATAVPGGFLFLENNRFTYNLQASSTDYGHADANPNQAIQGHAFRMQLVGAKVAPPTQGQERQSTYHNYFLGSDPKRWATKVPLFAAVRYEQVYAGVDMVWHSVDGQLKYDYELAPGADPSQIRMRYEGLDKLELLEGQLRLYTHLGVLAEQAPVAYQVLANGQRRLIGCRFRLDDQDVRFELTEAYDTKRPLIIDPALVFSTYTTNSTFLSANSAAGDEFGNMYTAGYAPGPTYPVTLGAYQTQQRGANMGISKLDPTGRTLLFATYLGGSNLEYPLDMTITAKNELIVLAITESSNYPMTTTAHDKSLSGSQDYVISRLSADGSALLASTYLGGGSYEGGSLFSRPATVTTNATGDVLVGGNTNSTDFPVRNALQPTLRSSTTNNSQSGNDGFVTCFNEALATLQWSTYLGGTAEDQVHDIKVAPDGTVYVCGQTGSADFSVGSTGLNRIYQGGQFDGFLLHLSATGNTLLGGTFLGTSAVDLARFIDFDSNDQVVVAGATTGNYPVTNGAYTRISSTGATDKVFIHCLTPALSSTAFSTQITIANSVSIGMFGSPQVTAFSGSTLVTAFNLDACNRLYFCAYSGNATAPVTDDAFSATPRSMYLAVLSPEARALEYGTFFGGPPTGGTHLHAAASNEITKQGVLYHIECTSTTQFTTTPNTFSPTKNAPVSGSFYSGAAFKFNMLPTGASLPTLTATLTPVPTGCAPYTVQFSNAGSGAETYEWDFGDGTPANRTPTPAHRFERAGTYQVRLTVTRTGGCGSQRLTAMTTVGVSSTTPIQLTDSLDCRAQLTLDAGEGGNKYEWSTGETTRSIVVKTLGVYRVLVSTTAPCPETKVFTIRPAGARNLYNIITPNGDQRNDQLVLPVELGIPELRIFNRWGREVYQSVAYRNEWQAQGQPAGMYYYQVRQPACALTLKGWVEVVR